MASGTPHIAFKEHDVIANKYRLVRELGKGGMGAVWEATHIEMGTRKAIKFMLANPSELSSESIERFRREAIAAGQLTSEYVIKAQDIDTLPSGELYIVMEYVEGKPLDKVLKEQGPLQLDLAAMYMLQVCKALQQAHRLGIVHRDLKPPNFLLSSDSEGRPCMKVFDFGIAKVAAPLTTSAEAALTRTSEVMGTPFYMAPEHYRSMKDLDERADIWALGVILYEVITGVRPFRGSDVGKIAVAVCTQTPEPPSRIYPAIPKEFDRIVFRCLEKEPENRFQSAEELAKALMPFAADPARFAVSVGLPLPLADTDRPQGFPMTRSSDSCAPAAALGTLSAPPVQLLPPERIAALHALVQNLGLADAGARNALFGGIGEIQNHLQQDGVPVRQLKLDLHALNELPPLDPAKQCPFEHWLHNAIQLCGHDPRREELRESLRLVQQAREQYRSLPPPSPTAPPRTVTEPLTGPNPAPVISVVPTVVPQPAPPANPPDAGSSNLRQPRSLGIGVGAGIVAILGIVILILNAKRSEAESDSAQQQMEPPSAQLSADPAPPASTNPTAVASNPTVVLPSTSPAPTLSNSTKMPIPSTGAKPGGRVRNDHE